MWSHLLVDHPILLKRAFVNRPVLESKLSLSMFLVGNPLADVDCTVGVEKTSFALALSIGKLTLFGGGGGEQQVTVWGLGSRASKGD
jgi:hypothetical protein